MRYSSSCAALVLAILSAAPASATPFSGDYTLTIYGAKGRLEATLCYTFTHQSQTVPGYRNSGTWVRVDDPIEAGNFVLDKGDLRFDGAIQVNDHLDILDYHVDTKTMQGGWDSWVAAPPPIASLDGGRVVMSPGC